MLLTCECKGTLLLINPSCVSGSTLKHREKIDGRNSFAPPINETDESVRSNTHYWSNCHCYALVSVSFPFYCRLYWPSFYWCYTDLMFQRSRNAPRVSSPLFLPPLSFRLSVRQVYSPNRLEIHWFALHPSPLFYSPIFDFYLKFDLGFI